MTNVASRVATALVICGSAMMLSVFVQFALWILDRTPPFSVESYTSTPTRRGELTNITAKVTRDLSKTCSVIYSRSYIDSSGAIMDLTDGMRMMDAIALSEFNKRSPNSLNIKVRIPESSSLGNSTVMTALEYTCNPLHRMFPIQLVIISEVEVLP